MELIGEIIAELFLEGSFALVKGKYPLWLKIPAIVIVSVVYISLIGFIGFIGIKNILEGHFIGGAVTIIVDIIIIGFIFKLFRNKK